MDKRPSLVQLHILRRMAAGWTINRSACRIAQFDTHGSLRRNIPERTFNVLLKEGWIEATERGINLYTITERGRRRITSEVV